MKAPRGVVANRTGNVGYILYYISFTHNRVSHRFGALPESQLTPDRDRSF